MQPYSLLPFSHGLATAKAGGCLGAAVWRFRSLDQPSVVQLLILVAAVAIVGVVWAWEMVVDEEGYIYIYIFNLCKYIYIHKKYISKYLLSIINIYIYIHIYI